ncbi:Zinc finger CCCH domain-containing protein 14 [Triplophysa tibetana]|uniref:Zinc finger CCCH domain-containing protein 14 n=1 Tax=Triplophysa tibetana TaxID=1572043 RepID=A0A5A9NHH7_9TELE|nr:Zinc finger CCCH domain-containing protein 14 [Triplophysa tibetana]
MEIGTEISKKIRAAIKGKLQELGAYVDEELPDYIMVMVANKKSMEQMAEDLSLFLGNNTITFTVWLNGVLEKLRSVAVVEPPSCPPVPHTEMCILTANVRIGEEPRTLAMSSSRSDKVEGWVSSSAHEHRGRGGSSERPSRLTSAVKPLIEASAEAVIDIKPDLDDDLIADDPLEQALSSSYTRGLYSRSAVERSRPVAASSGQMSVRNAEAYRPSDVTKGQERSSSSHGRGYRSSGESSREMSRKRKAPMASSVVRVHRGYDRGQESEDLEEDEDEEDYGLSSKVSLPAKPERKCVPLETKGFMALKVQCVIIWRIYPVSVTLRIPSIGPPHIQRRTVPVAPRTRSASNEINNAAVRLVQEHLHALTPQDTLQSSQYDNTAHSRALTSTLQLEIPEQGSRQQRDEYDLQVLEAARLEALDTRSFIMRMPEVDQRPPIRSRLGTVSQNEDPPITSRMVQARERTEVAGGASPKFIVTLDGVPSPLASRTDQEMEHEDESNVNSELLENDRPKPAVHLRLGTDLVKTDNGEMVEVEDMDVSPDQTKRQKLLERCKFWPTCKSGEECLYHHPNTPCTMFPNCKFGDKCLFIHPNCKFDAKCTKTDCPFTHVSRRLPNNPTRAAPAPNKNTCRFFPECKKTDCPFYHPKPCRFSTWCKRTDCTFYHPTVGVPPRSALKWTKTPSRYHKLLH